MPNSGPVRVPFPLSSFPGANPQEGSGRLINCYAEPLGEPQNPTGPAQQVWRRSPGLSQHNNAATGQTGYRGGLIVQNLSYELWKNEAATIDVSGNLILLGNFPGTSKSSIARNQALNPDVVAVDQSNGAYILNTAAVTSASLIATFAGSSFAPGDVVALTITNAAVAGLPQTVIYTLGSGESATTIATGLKNLINANSTLSAASISATSAAGALTISHQGALGNSTAITPSILAVGNLTTIVSAVTGTGNETVAIAGSPGSVTATVGGTSFVSGDTVSLTFGNPDLTSFPVKITYTLGAGESITTIATGLKNLINANANLTAVGIAATSSSAIVTITQTIGNETVTLNPANGNLAGGAGTAGISFSGAPVAYNGLGNLPQPNSICFQDGYFFFTIAAGQCYATALNSLSLNALTYITAQAKADVTLLRGISFSGYLLLFTTGSCEVWQDAAIPAPDFPYARQVVLEYGLIQSAAIAGFETGFSELLWVAQDFGVYWMTAGSLVPIKVSPSDLDRLIEAQVRAGNTLEAGCYTFAGKKFWALSSPAWTWEFNISTKKWSERWSLAVSGAYGRWRATGGHPAFGKWLMGDEETGNLLWLDSQNYTENGSPQLMRIESGPVRDFPYQIRIARFDADYDMGVGIAVSNVTMTVLGAAAGNGGVVRLTVNNTAQTSTNDTVNVSSVLGTTEANGAWPMTLIDSTHIELQGSIFKNTYVSSGIAVDVTSPPQAVSPSVAISCSKDGGITYDNPSIRSLALQAKTKRARASVKNRGLSGPMGNRWRLDVTDPVYTGFLGATQSSDPREVMP